MFVDLVFQHAMCMRRIMLPVLFYHIFPHSHKGHFSKKKNIGHKI